MFTFYRVVHFFSRFIFHAVSDMYKPLFISIECFFFGPSLRLAKAIGGPSNNIIYDAPNERKAWQTRWNCVCHWNQYDSFPSHWMIYGSVSNFKHHIILHFFSFVLSKWRCTAELHAKEKPGSKKNECNKF